MKKILRRVVFGLLTLVGIVVLAIAIFVNTSPQFGGTPTAEEKAEFEKTDHYTDGEFFNLLPTSMDFTWDKLVKLFKAYRDGVPNQQPDFKIPVEKIDSLTLVTENTQTKLIWFGHSAFLLQIDGKTILLDPMLTEVPAPVPYFGQKRYAMEHPIDIAKIPVVDAIMISHDHYDHLDYASIQQLKEKTKHFFVPLGVGAHFKAWGVSKEKIHELDWWQEADLDGIKLAFAPARHFSGRGITNRNSTLWGSWIIQSKTENIYFSGDGGYGPHFKEIGEKYGPFDIAMLECGQYNENWEQIHMMPEETAQAAIDVKAKLMMPIHWGAFTLALHSWTDPIERVSVKAEELGVRLIAPKIGEEVLLQKPQPKRKPWWIK